MMNHSADRNGNHCPLTETQYRNDSTTTTRDKDLHTDSQTQSAEHYLGESSRGRTDKKELDLRGGSCAAHCTVI